MMLCAKISQVLFFSHVKKCSNGDFSIVEYTGIKILKGWISSYIESSLYMFCKKMLCLLVALKITVVTVCNSMFRGTS